MRKTMLAMVALATAGTAALETAAISQPPPPPGDYGWYGDRPDWNPGDNYRERRWRGDRMRRDDPVYYGRDNRYYCRRSDGTTGTIVGGLGGALAGGLIGGSTLGALIGAGGGALLGRSIDRGKIHCR